MFSSSSPPDSGRIRCVCDYDDDDGFTIQCEQCLVWQHAKCVGISKNSVPEQYFCEECKPGWHEDLHNLAFRAINLDVMVGTESSTLTHTNQSTSTPFNVNIIEDSGNVPVQTRSGFKRRISVPAGVPALNEITENIISNDAQPVIDTFLKGINVPRLKRQQSAQDINLLNFEFQATPVMDSPEHLALLQKSLEVREIRNRGYQKKGSSTKYGLFATEYCDPGHFVCEFIGHVQLKTLLSVKGAKEVPVTVTQSFVLYPFASVELAIDSRKFGTGSRYARRSCRPNVQIKPIVVEMASGEYSLSWGLFSRNVIKANSEILLPLDYQCGNGLFRYECACNAPDFCLGPLDNFKDTNTNASSTIPATVATSTNIQRAASPKPSAFVESTELEALGIRRSSSAVLQDSQSAPSAATRPILDSRKLSREERKLQKYIEYFEKMDHADAAKKVTISSNSSLSSRKGSSSGSSPQRADSSSRNSSPEKHAGGAGLKKAWKQLFSSSGEGMDVNVEKSLDEIEVPVYEPVVTKPAGAKRGRKPAAAKIQTELPDDSSSVSANALQSSPLKPKKSPVKRKNAKATSEVAIVDEDSAEEIDVGFEEEGHLSEVKVSESTSSNKNLKKKAKIDKPKKSAAVKSKADSSINADVSVTSPLIDIERSSSVIHNNNNTEQDPLPIYSNVSTSVIPTPQPETPSKKKLSLSDYLKKKKASPVESVPLNFNDEEGNEEGEIVTNSSAAAAAVILDDKAEKYTYTSPRRPHEVSDYTFLTSVAVTKGPEEGESMRDYLRQSMTSNNSISMAMDLQSFENQQSETILDKDGKYMNDKDSRHSLIDSGYVRSSSRDYESRDSRDYESSGYKSLTGSKERNFKDFKDFKDLRETESRYNYPNDNNYKNRHGNYQQSSYQQHQYRPQSIVEPMRNRDRDDRDKEFDRLQREREFERREAERERERERRDRESGRFGGRPVGYNEESSSYSGYNNRSNPNTRGGYRPYRPHGYHANHNGTSELQRSQGYHHHHGQHGYQPRPPNYRPYPGNGNYKNNSSNNNNNNNNKY